MIFAIVLSMLAGLLLGNRSLKVILYVTLGILFNPITLLIAIVIIELSNTRGVK